MQDATCGMRVWKTKDHFKDLHSCLLNSGQWYQFLLLSNISRVYCLFGNHETKENYCHVLYFKCNPTTTTLGSLLVLHVGRPIGTP